MSAVCVLTPIVISQWPAIATAVASVAASMGFAVVASGTQDHTTHRAAGDNRVETEVPNSEVLEETMTRGEKMVIEKDGIRIEFGRDERGACSVCVSGEGYSKSQLKKIGEEVAGRVVQQFAYHKLMTELKKRNYDIVQENVAEDDSIRVRVRLGG